MLQLWHYKFLKGLTNEVCFTLHILLRLEEEVDKEPKWATSLFLTLSRNLKSFALLQTEGKWRSLTLLLPITFGLRLDGG